MSRRRTNLRAVTSTLNNWPPIDLILRMGAEEVACSIQFVRAIGEKLAIDEVNDPEAGMLTTWISRSHFLAGKGVCH